MFEGLDRWHKTKVGLISFAILELVICYAFASLAIDRGNLLYYGLVLLFLVGALQNILRLFKSTGH